MGCFLACFGSSKDRRRKCRKQQHKKQNKVQPRYQRNVAQDLEPSNLTAEQSQTSEKPVIISTVVEEIQEEKPQGQLSSPVLHKRVTFDSNVKTYEPVSVEESAEFQNAAPKQEFDNANDDHQIKYSKQDQSDTSSEASSLTSSSSSYPSNHRYQNCRDSDDEFDSEDQTDSDSNSEDEKLDYYDDIDDEPTTRFPSAVTDATTFPSDAANEDGCFPEVGIGKPGQNARDRSGYVHPVLNPVENLSQWMAAKSKKSAPPPLPPQPSDKENEQEPSFKVKSKKTVNQEQVVAVDASLSNWLSSPSSTSSSSDCCTTTPNKQPTTATSSTRLPAERSPGHLVGSASPKSFEDKPILGALTVEEIRQMSASASPIRKSPGHSPDDKFIIGSVGSYWRSDSESDKKKEVGSSASPTSSYKGIPNTTSKYREDKRVNWHSTPFETRLERALNGAQS